jgi:hypothetical protein
MAPFQVPGLQLLHATPLTANLFRWWASSFSASSSSLLILGATILPSTTALASLCSCLLGSSASVRTSRLSSFLANISPLDIAPPHTVCSPRLARSAPSSRKSSSVLFGLLGRHPTLQQRHTHHGSIMSWISLVSSCFAVTYHNAVDPQD